MMNNQAHDIQALLAKCNTVVLGGLDGGHYVDAPAGITIKVSEPSKLMENLRKQGAVRNERITPEQFFGSDRLELERLKAVVAQMHEADQELESASTHKIGAQPAPKP